LKESQFIQMSLGQMMKLLEVIPRRRRHFESQGYMLDQVIVKRDIVVDCFTIPFPLSEALESLVGWFYFLESA